MNKTSTLLSLDITYENYKVPGEEELNFALLDYIKCSSDLLFKAYLKLVQVSTAYVTLGCDPDVARVPEDLYSLKFRTSSVEEFPFLLHEVSVLKLIYSFFLHRNYSSNWSC